MNPIAPPSPSKKPLTIMLIALTIVLLCSFPTCLLAEFVDAQEWNITADKLTRYENPSVIIAEGGVILEKKENVTRQAKERADDTWDELLREEGAASDAEKKFITEKKTLTTIKADWMAYDVELGIIKARGNLFIGIGPDILTAEVGQVDLNKSTGSFDEATIIRQHKDMHLEGKVIEKTGDVTYRIEDGWVVTCKLKDGETPPWSFHAADVDITDGGYAYLKHATFRIKEVPVIYTPFMVLPVKRERLTGFLLPSYSVSDRDGFGLEAPFFINLSPSSDITLYPYYMAERGLKLGAEFRYIEDMDSKGSFMADYLNDALSDPSEVEYYNDGNWTHTNKERYWIRSKIDRNIGDWTTRFDMDIVSDEDYLEEFSIGNTSYDVTDKKFLDVYGRGFQDESLTHRKNTLNFLRDWKNGMSLHGEFLGINDLDNPEADSTPLWKLPSLNFTGLVPVYDNGALNFSWNTEYVNYWREQGVGAHRFDIHPTLSAAIPLSKYLETTVELGARDTLYFVQDHGDSTWDGNGTENRFLIDASAEIGFTMASDFAVSMDTISSLTHIIRPYIGHEFVSEDNEAIPLLDTVDEISAANMFIYGIDNYWNAEGVENGKDFLRKWAFFKIWQGYDFTNDEEDTPFTPVYMDMGFSPWPSFKVEYNTEYDVYETEFSAHTVELDYRSSRGDYLSADYKFTESTEVESVSAKARLALPANFFIGYGIERSLEDRYTIEENFSLLYKPSCWSVELSSKYTPEDRSVMITFRLANIGASLVGGLSSE